MTHFTKLTTLLIALTATASAMAFSAVTPSTPPPSVKPPSELCRGLGPADYAKCEEWVGSQIKNIKDVRAESLAKKNSFKAISVLLEFADGSTQNAKLAYEGVGSRVVPSGSRIKVDCRWSHLPATQGQPFTEGNCILKFPRLELDWMDPNYSVHFGKQPDLGIGMDGAGFLDVDFVEMLDPISKSKISPAFDTENIRLIK